jgi:hypothetical protein
VVLREALYNLISRYLSYVDFEVVIPKTESQDLPVRCAEDSWRVRVNRTSFVSRLHRDLC